MTPLYILGAPGNVGGASTKIRDLIPLLQNHFRIKIVARETSWLAPKVKLLLKRYQVDFCYLRDLRRPIEGVALIVCDPDFFTSGAAMTMRNLGLKIVFSNEMMWPFAGEAEGARDGLVDKVLFVSELQASRFKEIYSTVPHMITGNYIPAAAFPFHQRRNVTFSIGRLSRPDPAKYPEDFPVFYEELGLDDVRYRVMAWDHILRSKYAWHTFGPNWDLLGPDKEESLHFLHSLDLLVYPLGHTVKESWGRSVVEAMLTGCIPLVPTGHYFGQLMKHGESGFLCEKFDDYKALTHELFQDYPLRVKISSDCSRWAREHLCNEAEHLSTWLTALS